MPCLYMLSGSNAGDTHDIKKGITSLGRGPDNDIQIIDPSISRKHARILLSGDRLLIEDLESQNGVRLNGHRISPCFPVEIKEGDFISLGTVLMSLGKPYAEEGMVTQYSISLKPLPQKAATNLLHDEDRRAAERENLETLCEVSTLLLQSLDIDEIGERILDSIFACIKNIDDAALLLADQETGESRQVCARSRNQAKEFRITYSRTLVNRVIREGKALTLSEPKRREEQDPSESTSSMKIKSVMCVPLIGKTDVYGVLYAHSGGVPPRFSKSDLHLLSALSTPAALAVENALCYATHRKSEATLETIRGDLEKKIQERTAELSKANVLLRQEIAIRAQAQENLNTMHERLKEANKNLELAYSRMREAKDRLRNQLYREEIAVLMDEKGVILGVTEKAVETFARTRFDLFGRNIIELFPDDAQASIAQDIQNSRIGVFEQTLIHFRNDPPESAKNQVRFFPISLKSGKMLLALMRRPDQEAAR